MAASVMLSGCLPVYRMPLEIPVAAGDVRRVIAAHCRLPVTRANNVGFFVGGEPSHRAMLDLIHEARRTLYVEMFIFHFDATGREIADALIQQANAGLDVRVRLDSLGIEYGREDYKLIDYLQKGGVHVQIHNPFYWSPHGFNVTHRKILVADEGHALTGGVNIGDAFRYGYFDLMLDVRGEAAHHIAWIFKRAWGGDLAEANPPIGHNVYASEEAGSAVGDEPLQVALMEPGSAPEVRAAYLLAARNAKRTLDVAFPYMWDEELIQAFLAAVHRGVRLRLLL
ncbi:MAG TPA: phospholipase D-like domain-containing protein, partial [Stenomitos sp.]